ncbi:hypothetical protein VOLCADRAFT_95166 [Volvox carteri f. nagariensis]|uniref:CHASE domain-containing protein n=1 Tax=Volvox carteri f. nagariensis TaxID=3068 RepID=D8U6S5_VOLCA|nr:uncharacterized protein VOLCADRAFT_95166 [Volvox carteri f. nagariensis]EFJ44491.1 hypothetical protein VOLCADRAFT_95166 [Volvox carteri f. nagariensis]|eukprot:XP_002954341.1 hypothetical protein VOLCADRAFT_95166 [Volvox carteri f. nagariensis]
MISMVQLLDRLRGEAADCPVTLTRKSERSDTLNPTDCDAGITSDGSGPVISCEVPEVSLTDDSVAAFVHTPASFVFTVVMGHGGHIADSGLRDSQPNRFHSTWRRSEVVRGLIRSANAPTAVFSSFITLKPPISPHVQDKELVFALSAAVYLLQQLTTAISPLHLMTAIVQYNPQYSAVQSMFAGLAPALLAQTPPGLIPSLQYLPNGVLRDVFPPRGNETGIGSNVFQSAEQREEAVAMVRENTTSLHRLYDTVQGQVFLVARTPIFVSGMAPNETFGNPDTLDPYCGAACGYNATSRTKFWGFAAVQISFEVVTDFITSKLAALEGLGFQYEIRGLGLAPDTVIRSSQTREADAVRVTLPIADKNWEVSVSRTAGRRSGVYQGLLAGVIVLAVALALLMFAALVSRITSDRAAITASAEIRTPN